MFKKSKSEIMYSQKDIARVISSLDLSNFVVAQLNSKYIGEELGSPRSYRTTVVAHGREQDIAFDSRMTLERAPGKSQPFCVSRSRSIE